MSGQLTEADLALVLRSYLLGEISLAALDEWTARWEWSVENVKTPFGQAMGTVMLVIHEVGDGVADELDAHRTLFQLLETIRERPTVTTFTVGGANILWTLDRRVV